VSRPATFEALGLEGRGEHLAALLQDGLGPRAVDIGRGQQRRACGSTGRGLRPRFDE
jgi:hypothetical protein